MATYAYYFWGKSSLMILTLAAIMTQEVKVNSRIYSVGVDGHDHEISLIPWRGPQQHLSSPSTSVAL